MLYLSFVVTQGDSDDGGGVCRWRANVELDKDYIPSILGEKVWDEAAKKYTYVTQDYEEGGRTV